MRKHWWHALFLTSAATLSSCGADEPAIEPNVTVISDALAAKVTVEADRLVFPAGEGDFLLNLPKGQILVSGYQPGFLRKRLSASRAADTVVVSTDLAVLTDAVRQGSLSTNLDLAAGTSNPQALTAGVSFDVNVGGVKLIDEPTFQLEFVGGNITFAPSVDLDFEVQNSQLKKFSLVAGGTMNASAAVKATLGGSITRSGEKQLWQSQPRYFTQFIGIVPVIEEVRLSLHAGYEAKATASTSLQFGKSAQGAISGGARFQDGEWTKVESQSLTFTAQTTTSSDVGAMVRVFLRPQIDVKFYSVAGPFMNLELGPELVLTVLPEPAKWELNARLDGNVGGSIEVLGRQLAHPSATLFTFQHLIASHVFGADGGVDAGADSGIGGSGGAPDASAGGTGGMSTGGSGGTSSGGTSSGGSGAAADASSGGSGGGDAAADAGLTNPILSLKFDEGTGALALDATGNGHHAALQGAATWAAGRCLTAVDLRQAGAAAVVQHASVVDLSAPQSTLSFWVWLDATPSSNLIMTKRDFTGDQGWDVRVLGTAFTFFADCCNSPVPTGASGAVVSGSPAALGQWQHVVVVIDNGTSKLYLDGSLAGTTPNGWVYPDLANLTLGANAPATIPHLMLDELRIYDVALPQSAITTLATAPCSVP